MTTLGKHTITDVYSLGKVTFTALLGSVTLEAALIARYWTWVFLWIVILSYVLVYPYMLIFPYIELGLNYYDPANVGVAEEVMSSPVFWFVIIICYSLTFGSRLTEKTIQWVFYPHDDMILAEKEHMEERSGGLLANLSGESRLRLQQLGTFTGRNYASKTLNERMDSGLDDSEYTTQSNSQVNRKDTSDSVNTWQTDLRPGKVPV